MLISPCLGGIDLKSWTLFSNEQISTEHCLVFAVLLLHDFDKNKVKHSWYLRPFTKLNIF